MPPERPKKLRNGADYESAFILLRITSKDKFDITVVRPVDMKVFLTNSQNGSALIKVELRRKKYYFDIPKSVRGTGAASLALAYAIQHATRMGIPALEAPLTHIDDEEHRIRLCGFYSRKFQFQYRAADGYIIKSLL